MKGGSGVGEHPCIFIGNTVSCTRPHLDFELQLELGSYFSLIDSVQFFKDKVSPSWFLIHYFSNREGPSSYMFFSLYFATTEGWSLWHKTLWVLKDLATLSFSEIVSCGPGQFPTYYKADTHVSTS